MILKIHTPSPSVKILIYGKDGIGKLALAMTILKTYIVDMKREMQWFDKSMQKDYCGAHSLEEVNRIFTAKYTSVLKKYDVIAINGIDKLLNIFTEKIINLHPEYSADQKLTPQGIGALLQEFRIFVSKISILGKHVIFIANESNADEVHIRPDINGAVLGSVMKEMDLVGYMYRPNGVTTISFTPNAKFTAKNPYGLPGTVSIPKFSATEYNPVKILFRHFTHCLNSKSFQEYKDLMQAIDIRVMSIVDSDTALLVSEEFKTIPEILDSKLISRIKFLNRITELKLVYNPHKQIFEPFKIRTR